MTLPKMRPGNLTVTTLLAKRRAVMLPYFAAYTTAEIPSTSPWAVQLLMISGKIPLCALLWMGTNQPAPRPDQYRHALTSNFQFAYNMVNFPKQNKSLVVP